MQPSTSPQTAPPTPESPKLPTKPVALPVRPAPVDGNMPKPSAPSPVPPAAKAKPTPDRPSGVIAATVIVMLVLSAIAVMIYLTSST